MSLKRAMGAMKPKEGGGPGEPKGGRVKKVQRRTRAQFIEGTHRNRTIPEYTGADIVALWYQTADWQGWKVDTTSVRAENAVGARLIEAYGGPAPAASMVLAACHGDQFGLEKPRKLSWLIPGNEYSDRVLVLYGALLDVAAAELPGVTAAVRMNL